MEGIPTANAPEVRVRAVGRGLRVGAADVAQVVEADRAFVPPRFPWHLALKEPEQRAANPEVGVGDLSPPWGSRTRWRDNPAVRATRALLTLTVALAPAFSLAFAFALACPFGGALRSLVAGPATRVAVARERRSATGDPGGILL